MITSPRDDNTANLSFLNNSFVNRQNKNNILKEQSRGLRDISSNTISNLQDSRPSSQNKMKSIVMTTQDFLNQSSLSCVYNLEDNPTKTKEFYKEFSNAIDRNRKGD